MGKPKRVLIELRHPEKKGKVSFSLLKRKFKRAASMQLDEDFAPMRMKKPPQKTEGETLIVRATLDEEDIKTLRADPDVIEVWDDAPIAPFGKRKPHGRQLIRRKSQLRRPIINVGKERVKSRKTIFDVLSSAIDCDTSISKGNLQTVADTIGVDHLWEAGLKGKGIVIGIVDFGITAEGRIPYGHIPNVIGGYPTDSWGQIASWTLHGNMTATDALGMAPEANLYDICILEDGISSAMLGYDWAIEQFKKDGTPQILSNSWGIYDASKAPNYATNPNHPFSRKVAEAIDLGITVLFSAGNCGESCPSSRCEDYTGPGKDIWGANGHPDVITVGAMNQNLEWIGYSSSGPAALCDEKPDVCGISHFKGYFDPDTGTSAACPIVAGLVALLLQMSPHHKPATIQAVLQETALQIDGKTGWDSRTGYGLVQAEKAAEILKPKWLEPFLYVMMQS